MRGSVFRCPCLHSCVYLAPGDKIRLFRAMFRGREDVYARRYVSAKSGKSGYSPVCAIEWTQGLCDKRKGLCA